MRMVWGPPQKCWLSPHPTPRRECRSDGDSGAEPYRSSDDYPVSWTRENDQGIVLGHVDQARSRGEDLDIASVGNHIDVGTRLQVAILFCLATHALHCIHHGFVLGQYSISELLSPRRIAGHHVENGGKW